MASGQTARALPQPAVVSWSGGKDSTLMLERLLHDERVEVRALLTTVSTVYDRVSIHGVRRSILRAQAASLGLPLFEVALGAHASNEDYEAAFARGVQQLEAAYPDTRCLAFGDLFLEDVRAYREAMLARLGWRGLYPLWGEETGALARYFVQRGYEATLTCVDTQQLDGAFAGRRYDDALLDALPATVDPCGERGEFHTCVTGGPIFDHPIAVTTGERVLRDERFQYCDLVEVPPGPAGRAASGAGA
jgi:uncharacterized protein (TIGR00290 family)